jgi:hypothetical protein
MPWTQQPGIDPISSKAAEGCVLDIKSPIRRTDRLKSQIEVEGTGLFNCFAPKRVEVIRLGDSRPILDELFEGEVVSGHSINV